MFVLVAYDVSDTNRRNKVAKILAGYGERVNLSVFECEFRKSNTFQAMKQEIRKAIKPKEDHIRYYPICKECRGKISVQGYGKVTEEEVVRFA